MGIKLRAEKCGVVLLAPRPPADSLALMKDALWRGSPSWADFGVGDAVQDSSAFLGLGPVQRSSATPLEKWRWRAGDLLYGWN